jgi:hypothetical protein
MILVRVNSKEKLTRLNRDCKKYFFGVVKGLSKMTFSHFKHVRLGLVIYFFSLFEHAKWFLIIHSAKIQLVVLGLFFRFLSI